MMKKVFFVLAPALVSMAAVSWAADAEHAGDYAGTIKHKIYAASGKTAVKAPLTLSLANGTDDTTLTIGGSPADGGAIFTGASGLMEFQPDTTTYSVSLASLEFKNGRIKGTAVGLIYGPPLKTIESKITLKKTAP